MEVRGINLLAMPAALWVDEQHMVQCSMNSASSRSKELRYRKCQRNCDLANIAAWAGMEFCGGMTSAPSDGQSSVDLSQCGRGRLHVRVTSKAVYPRRRDIAREYFLPAQGAAYNVVWIPEAFVGIARPGVDLDIEMCTRHQGAEKVDFCGSIEFNARFFSEAHSNVWKG